MSVIAAIKERSAFFSLFLLDHCSLSPLSIVAVNEGGSFSFSFFFFLIWLDQGRRILVTFAFFILCLLGRSERGKDPPIPSC
jgi:hypothetical protein